VWSWPSDNPIDPKVGQTLLTLIVAQPSEPVTMTQARPGQLTDNIIIELLILDGQPIIIVWQWPLLTVIIDYYCGNYWLLDQLLCVLFNCVLLLIVNYWWQLLLVLAQWYWTVLDPIIVIVIVIGNLLLDGIVIWYWPNPDGPSWAQPSIEIDYWTDIVIGIEWPWWPNDPVARTQTVIGIGSWQ